jgi:hypothetical protein
MLLPINLFDNLTAYTKTNWQCGLGPKNEITWSPYAVSTVENWDKLNVVAKGNYTKFTFKDEAADANYIAGAIYASVSSYQGWVPVYKITFKSKEAMDDFGPATNGINFSFWGLKLQNITLTAYWIDERNLVAYYIFAPNTLKYLKANKGQKFAWFAISNEKPIDKAHCKSLEVQMVPVDWLAAGKKASIAVGDKLGLVYWDGTITAGGNFLLIKNSTIQTDADYLNFYHEGAYTKILDTAGTTMWFSGAPLQAAYHDGAWDYSTTATNELLPHLWHVI